MSQSLPAFDPSFSMNGFIDVGAADPGSKILLYNLSIVNLKLDFDNGSTDMLHAGEARWWQLDEALPQLYWIQDSVLANVKPALSRVTATLYGADEKISGQYPISLIHQIVIGNPNGVDTNTMATNANAIVNDGNAAGAQFMEATPTGAATSYIFADNQGTLHWKAISNGVLTEVLTVIPGTATTAAQVLIHGQADTVPAAGVENGNLPGGVTVQGSSIAGAIGPGQINAGNLASGVIVAGSQVQGNLAPGGTATFTKVLWGAGSISALSVVAGSGAQTVAHHLGAAPTIVIPIYTGNFGVTPSTILFVKSTDATNITVTAQGGYSWLAFCMIT